MMYRLDGSGNSTYGCMSSAINMYVLRVIGTEPDLVPYLMLGDP